MTGGLVPITKSLCFDLAQLPSKLPQDYGIRVNELTNELEFVSSISHCFALLWCLDRDPLANSATAAAKKMN